MRRNSVRAVILAIGLVIQMAMVPSVRAEEPDTAVALGATAFGVLGTIIALPVRAVTCVATVVLGGVGYGLTAGTAEFVKQELVAGIPYACSAKEPFVQPHIATQAAEEGIVP
jgi:hypothetical protein